MLTWVGRFDVMEGRKGGNQGCRERGNAGLDWWRDEGTVGQIEGGTRGMKRWNEDGIIDVKVK